MSTMIHRTVTRLPAAFGYTPFAEGLRRTCDSDRAPIPGCADRSALLGGCACKDLELAGMFAQPPLVRRRELSVGREQLALRRREVLRGLGLRGRLRNLHPLD